MQIEKCKAYHAITVGQNLLRMPDNKSKFKIYYLSVIGRDNPEQVEWEHSPHTQADFEKIFLSGNHEGVGFVTAFPHITKVFRFSPFAETVIDVKEYRTVDMQPKDCTRGDGSHEFACYAESAIAAEEHKAWAKATTVDEYMAFRCPITDFLIASHTKLATYWQ